MPKIFNTSWLAVSLATVVFYAIGAVWYGFLFSDIWVAASHLSEAEMKTMADAQGPMMLVWGLLVTLGQALGILWLIDRMGITSLGKALTATVWLFVMIGAPLLAYSCLYGGYSLSGILVDYGHILVGWLAVAAIYGFFRK